MLSGSRLFWALGNPPNAVSDKRILAYRVKYFDIVYNESCTIGCPA